MCLIFQGIKDYYDRLSEPETEMLLNVSKQFSGNVDNAEEDEEEYDEDI